MSGDKSTIESKIASMSPREFEHYVAGMLKYFNYSVKMIAFGAGDKKSAGFPSNDFGVDLVCKKKGIKCAVQIKHTKNNSSYINNARQEVVTGKALYGCTCSMVITNGPSLKSKNKLAEVHECEVISGKYFYSMAEEYENYNKNIFKK